MKEAVAQALAGVEDGTDAEKLAVQAELYEKYQGCTQDAQLVAPTSTFFVAARQCGAAVSNLGSIFFEEMSCCGYDPQRRQFACPVKIKQPFGFGGAPLPGSREHVLHCVADANGVLQPVGHDSVHLANAVSGSSRRWQFAVIAAANQNLFTGPADERPDPSGALDPVVGAAADQLQLPADLGQRAELSDPSGSIRRPRERSLPCSGRARVGVTCVAIAVRTTPIAAHPA